MRGWRRLSKPITKINNVLIQEFYANAVRTEAEIAGGEDYPYLSYVRGVPVGFFVTKIREVLKIHFLTPGAETDFKTRKIEDQRLDEVIRDICVPGARWKMSSSQPDQPIQLKRQDLTPLARGWAEFIIHSIIPTGNKSEITVARAVLIHSIIDKPYFDGLGGKDDLKRVLRACILENHEEKKQMANCPSNYSCVGNS
ncbi:hypothetical protein PIB30_087852 [Stylosanthes scabra]|uniref:Putative plant transposon protein domain-containing protein n=1 Tax=Stylosanthes scabra TaxID=79078 RepID=A0ABU6VUP9_9FABA|nr:hypothetical protein [Stylosanthes scabra]